MEDYLRKAQLKAFGSIALGVDNFDKVCKAIDSGPESIDDILAQGIIKHNEYEGWKNWETWLFYNSLIKPAELERYNIRLQGIVDKGLRDLDKIDSQSTIESFSNLLKREFEQVIGSFPITSFVMDILRRQLIIIDWESVAKAFILKYLDLADKNINQQD